jgi:hypothetical protein
MLKNCFMSPARVKDAGAVLAVEELFGALTPSMRREGRAGEKSTVNEAEKIEGAAFSTASTAIFPERSNSSQVRRFAPWA